MLMKFQWKVKGSLKSKLGGGGGSYHMACAVRRLRNHCDEVGRLSIQKCLIEKSNKRIKHEEDVTAKAEHFQGEATMKSKSKRGGGMQQKIHLH